MSAADERLQILAVDDDPGTVREIESIVDDAKLQFQFADTQNAISRVLESESIDLAVIHVHGGSQALMEPLNRQLRALKRPVAIIALVDPDAESAAAVARFGVEGAARIDDPRNLGRLIGDRVRQIRESRAQTEALRQVSDIHERYNLLLESSREAIAYLHEGLHIYANPSYLEQFGYDSFAELEGYSILDLLPTAKDGTDLKQLLRSLSHGDIPDHPVEMLAQRADGSNFEARADFSPARYAGEACTQIMVRERAIGGDNEELQQELEKLRSHDLLTGLLNRQAFIKSLHSDIDRTDDDGYTAVLLVTLDDHAGLQKKVGAAATDQIIKQIAALFGQVARPEDLPTRLSDYVLALRRQVPERSDAEAMATELVEHFSGKILEIHDKSPSITVSVGLSIGSGQMFSADELLAQAQGALNEAERTGGNCYMRFRPSADTGDSDDVSRWSERLRHALNNREFRLVRLPITSMEDDSFTIHEIESRLRMEGSDEIILPSTFRPAAAKAGLATDLDRDLIERLTGLENDGKPLQDDLLVPLSLPSLVDEAFIDWLQQRIDTNVLNPQRLILGFFEPEIRESLRELQRFISRFSARGVRFALLGVMPDARVDLLLKNVTVNYIKLDGNVSAALGRDEKARTALESLVKTAREDDILVIAPQVENTSDLATLWQFGITLIQDDFIRDEQA